MARVSMVAALHVPVVLLGVVLIAPRASAQDVQFCLGDDQCQDGIFCNGIERCVGLPILGTCAPGTPVTCPAPDACHGDGFCDESQQACVYPTNDGGSCDDGNACTVNDRCTGGTCAGDALACPGPTDACHQGGGCDPASGCLPVVPVQDGTGCSDGNACTDGDACFGGACVPGTPHACRAPGPCEEAVTCDPGSGACVATPRLDGTPCDDGNACTTVDTCRSGACVGDAPVTCTPIDQCHDAGSCDPRTGVCSTPPTRDGTPCDDGDACTRRDTCRGGVCTPGPQLVCDDGASCTDDRCVAGACVFTPVPGRCTSVGCTRAECRPGDHGADANGCVVVPVAVGDACTDDGIACTNDVCRDGGCAHDPDSSRCTPADECGTAVCFPGFPGADASGCAPGPPGPDGSLCSEDQDPCTDDRCLRGTCQHANVANRDQCVPVTAAYRDAVALVDALAALRASVARETAGGNGSGRALTDQPLAAMQADLVTVIAVLSGRAPAANTGDAIATRRVRAAMPLVKAMPPRLKTLKDGVRAARRGGTLSVATARALLTQAGSVRAQLKVLRRDMRAAQRIVQQFAR